MTSGNFLVRCQLQTSYLIFRVWSFQAYSLVSLESSKSIYSVRERMEPLDV